MRKSWHVAHKFCTFSGSYLMRSTRTLVTVKRELHGPDSCWSSFLSQQGKSTSAITRWFISSGHWHLCDESPIQTSLHPPIICRPLNQHNQLKPTMSLLPSYSWVTWIHPKNPHLTSKGSLNWFFFFFEYEQSHLSTVMGIAHHTLINYFFHWCHDLWWGSKKLKGTSGVWYSVLDKIHQLTHSVSFTNWLCFISEVGVYVSIERDLVYSCFCQ